MKRKPDPKIKRVAIVAYGPTRALTPYYYEDYPDAEVWGLNAVGRLDDEWRFDRMFDPHPYGAGCGTETWGPKLDWYLEWGKRVYLLKPHPELPESRAYPLEEIAKRFTPLTKGEKYFASTHAYMIAMAIDKGVEEIGLYGCEFISAKEKSDQRSCTSWLLGYAQGLGIKVHVPEGVNLLEHDHVYGFEPDPTEQWNAENLRTLLNDGSWRLHQIQKILQKELDSADKENR